MTKESSSCCARLTVGGEDCKNQIEKRKCSALSSECTGRSGGIGADTLKATQLVEAKKRVIAVEKLEMYRSTQKGGGHLSDVRAVHSSSVPFR